MAVCIMSPSYDDEMTAANARLIAAAPALLAAAEEAQEISEALSVGAVPMPDRTSEIARIARVLAPAIAAAKP